MNPPSPLNPPRGQIRVRGQGIEKDPDKPPALLPPFYRKG